MTLRITSKRGLRRWSPMWNLAAWTSLSLLSSCAQSRDLTQQLEQQGDSAAPSVLVSPLAVAPKPPAASTPSSSNAKRAAELVRRLGPALSHDISGLHPLRSAAGPRLVNLQGRFHHALVAHVDDSGAVQIGCVDSAEQAEALLSGGAGPAP